MSKKQRREKNRKRQPPLAKPAREESQKAEAMTVFWMMSLLVTVLGEAVALAARAYVVLVSAVDEVVLLSNLVLLISCITGLLCLGLTPLVLRWRRTAPPVAITRFAIAASLLPVVTVAALFILGKS